MGLYLATRTPPTGAPRAFRNAARLFEALSRSDLSHDDTVRVAGRVTTAGRFLAGQCLPPSVRGAFAGAPWDAWRVARALSYVARDLHVELAARAAEAFESLGRFVVERSGLSIALKDFAPPPKRHAILAETRARHLDVQRMYDADLLTDAERRNKQVDLWAEAADRIRSAVGPLDIPNDALVPFEVSGDAKVYQRLRAPTGLLPGRSGEIVELPVLHTPSEGISPHECMIVCMYGRSNTLAQTQRDHEAAALLGDLHAALSTIPVVVRDCGTRRGVRVRAVEEPYGEAPVLRPVRIEGHVVSEDVVAPGGVVLALAGELITRTLAERIEYAAVPHVTLRDPRTCEADEGVCALCFGLDRDDATWPAPGDPVSERAAWSIAHAARFYDDRIFHLGC